MGCIIFPYLKFSNENLFHSTLCIWFPVFRCVMQINTMPETIKKDKKQKMKKQINKKKNL